MCTRNTAPHHYLLRLRLHHFRDSRCVQRHSFTVATRDVQYDDKDVNCELCIIRKKLITHVGFDHVFLCSLAKATVNMAHMSVAFLNPDHYLAASTLVIPGQCQHWLWQRQNCRHEVTPKLVIAGQCQNWSYLGSAKTGRHVGMPKLVIAGQCTVIVLAAAPLSFVMTLLMCHSPRLPSFCHP
jgi:hypothetical protein